MKAHHNQLLSHATTDQIHYQSYNRTTPCGIKWKHQNSSLFYTVQKSQTRYTQTEEDCKHTVSRLFRDHPNKSGQKLTRVMTL